MVDPPARPSSGADGLSADQPLRPERPDEESFWAETSPRALIDRLEGSSGVADASSAEPSGMEPPLAHQPRESPVPCNLCRQSTWEFHAKCIACGPTSCERCAPA